MLIEHVNLTVSNLQRSMDFYCKLFDFHVRWRADASADKQEAHVGNDELYVAFYQAPRPGAAEVDYDRVGLNHFGIIVDDLEKYRQRLSELDVRPHHEPEYPPGRRFYFYDPDKIEVELVEYAR
jgi:catechol 2,3-dioxygenase-like lactoylglutathione lyase family enzyme